MTGPLTPALVSKVMAAALARAPEFRLDYAEVADPVDLTRPQRIQGEVRLLIAAHLGRARLIDNVAATAPSPTDADFRTDPAAAPAPSARRIPTHPRSPRPEPRQNPQTSPCTRRRKPRMRRRMLKSKIHRATVTDADLNYVGSISLDPVLMKGADILEHEQVAVLDIDNGARFETYAITGQPGQVCCNGAAARLVHPGDKVIILTYADYERRRARGLCTRGRARRPVEPGRPVPTPAVTGSP